MATHYRSPPTKALPPLPPGFRDNFIRGGWRLCERMYGCRTDRLLAWHQKAGGEELNAARCAALGRKPK